MFRSQLARRLPRPLAALAAAFLALYLVPLMASPAAADVVRSDGGSGCNGTLTTPGSENTIKTVVGGDFQPGGTVTFELKYPGTVNSPDDFVVTDCLFARTSGTPGTPFKANTADQIDEFTLTGVPNTGDNTYDYVVNIPDTLPLGTEVCNFAKTTASPSDPQASNRKGYTCFTVGGTLRIEKHDAITGQLLTGAEAAKFDVVCSPSDDVPITIIAGLWTERDGGTAVATTYNADGTATASGFANDGFIAIEGPEGTTCTVTETEAPPGYVLPTNPVHTYTVQRAGTDETHVINNNPVTPPEQPVPTNVTTQVADDAVQVGADISDTATVNPSAAEGTVTFSLYGPDDADCTGDAIFTSDPVDVVDGQASSPPFTTTDAGTYRWVAAFTSADEDLFTSSSGSCNDANEATVVAPAVVPTGSLSLLKEVSPDTSQGGKVSFGDVLTYTLTATAHGVDQPNAVITDFVPGFDPDVPSDKTTYVAGSATCVGTGDCIVTEPSDANGQLITWELGTLAAGESRSVTFQVTADRPPAPAGTAAVARYVNIGAVESSLTPSTPSNKVTTDVTEVLGEQIPGELPKTGATVPIGRTAGTAIALLLLGIALVAAPRRRGRHG